MKKLLAAIAALLALLVILTGAQAAAPLPSTGDVTLVDKAFRCDNYAQPLHLDTLKVTLTAAYAGVLDDAINLNHGDCTGTIGRIEVDTSIGDGVKIGSTAHDLTIGGGYIYCHARKDGKHQDGVQALGGNHVHFQNLNTYCPTSNNASFFLTAGANGSGTPTTPDWPTDVTCENCNLDGGAQTVSIAASIDSGVFDSVVHTGKFTDHRVQPEAVRPVYANNVVVPCDLNCQ
jgi:hypothetical protein